MQNQQKWSVYKMHPIGAFGFQGAPQPELDNGVDSGRQFAHQVHPSGYFDPHRGSETGCLLHLDVFLYKRCQSK